MFLRSAVSVCLVALATASVSADVILSNLPGNSSGTGTNLGLGTDAADRTKAVGLTMGGSSLDFLSLTALTSNPDSVARQLSGGIYSNVGGNPGVLLAAFVPADVAAGATSVNTTVTTAGTFTLAAGATYWFVLDGPAVTNSLLWDSLSPNAAPTGSGGVSFLGYRFSSNGGTSWGSSSIFNGVEISAVPGPGALTVLCSAGVLAFRRRR